MIKVNLKKIKDNRKFIIYLSNGEKLVNIGLFNNLTEAKKLIKKSSIDYIKIFHNNNIIYFESSTGYWSKRKYDKNNNEIYYENSTGFWNKIKYDKNNNWISIENSNGYWDKRKYDKNNNLISLENSNG